MTRATTSTVNTRVSCQGSTGPAAEKQLASGIAAVNAAQASSTSYAPRAVGRSAAHSTQAANTA